VAPRPLAACAAQQTRS